MKKSNKILAVLLALVMILVAVPTVMAEEVHEHTYVQQGEGTAATCTEDGKAVSKCECGDVIEVITEAKKGHAWDEGAVTTAATCTEAGVKTFTCTVCGETKTEEISAAHKFDALVEKNAETHTYQCSVCGKDNVAEAHAWDEGAVTKETTCKEAGVKEFKCACGETKTEEIPMLAEHSWNEGAITKNETCTEAGVKTYTCLVCGETKNEEIPAAHKFDSLLEKDAETHTYQCSVCGRDNTAEAHTWDEGTITTEPTCDKAGVKTFACVCGETKTEEVPAAHKFDALVEKNDETHTYQCSVCGKDNVAEAHTWDEGTVTKEATCKEAGEKEVKCACGQTKTVEIPVLEEHTWNEGEVTEEPDCGVTGVKTYTCTVCEATKTEEIPAVSEHDWDEWKVILEPTTENPGIKTRICKNCGDVEIEEIEKLEAAEPVPGDVNGDGNVSAMDARLVLQYVAGLETLTEEQMAVADVSGDDKVSAVDARYILQVVAGLIK